MENPEENFLDAAVLSSPVGADFFEAQSSGDPPIGPWTTAGFTSVGSPQSLGAFSAGRWWGRIRWVTVTGTPLSDWSSPQPFDLA